MFVLVNIPVLDSQWECIGGQDPFQHAEDQVSGNRLALDSLLDRERDFVHFVFGVEEVYGLVHGVAHVEAWLINPHPVDSRPAIDVIRSLKLLNRTC